MRKSKKPTKSRKISFQKSILKSKKGILIFTVLFGIIGGYLVYTSSAATNPLSGNGGEFHPINPARIMDSRTGNGTAKAVLKQGETRTLTVRGRGGVGTKANAAALNFTVTSTQGPGFLSAFPADQTRPNTSVLNFDQAGQTIANMVQLGLSADGKIKIYNGSSTPVHVIVDVGGYYVAPDGANGLRIFRTAATRIYDSRNFSAIPANGSRVINIQKSKLHPQTYYQDIEAVELNLVAINPAADGYLAAYPSGISKPNISSVSFNRSRTIANAVIVKVGSNDQITIFNGSSQPVHFLADISIAFRGRNEPNNILSGKFVAVKPYRAFDTRTQNSSTSSGTLSPSEHVTTSVVNRGGVPAQAYGVAANFTVTGATSTGYIVSNYEDTVSLMNYGPGQMLANSKLQEIVGDGLLVIGNGKSSQSTTHLIIDVMGYFR